MFVLTRVNASALRADAQTALSLFLQLSALLDGHLPPTLTDKDRKRIPRPSTAFDNAARALAAAARQRPSLAVGANFDPDAVLEDLDNLKTLIPLIEGLQVLLTRLNDSVLLWNAEAYVPALALYALAKVRARTDGELQALVDPMAEIFGKGHRTKIE